MADGDVVATKEVHVFVQVRQWDQEDSGIMYDWVASNGAESDELFESVDEALHDGMRRFE